MKSSDTKGPLKNIWQLRAWRGNKEADAVNTAYQRLLKAVRTEAQNSTGSSQREPNANVCKIGGEGVSLVSLGNTAALTMTAHANRTGPHNVSPRESLARDTSAPLEPTKCFGRSSHKPMIPSIQIIKSKESRAPCHQHQECAASHTQSGHLIRQPLTERAYAHS